MNTRITTPRSLALIAAATMTLGACGQWRMADTNASVRKHSVAGDFEKALATWQARKYDDFKPEDSVMYWMNEGMLLYLVGRYEESIRVLGYAEQRSRELFTKSASKHVKAAFTSNAALDYQGEDHEKVLIHVIKALGFLSQDNREGALVEARKINRVLEYLNTVYTDHGNTYSEDAFAHWLTGMLFELEGSHDDARIAFERALRVYDTAFSQHYGTSAPSWLAEDVARAARASGDTERLDKLRIERSDDTLGRTADMMRTHGEVILVHLNGEGPTKIDKRVTCYHYRGANIPPRCDHTPGGAYLIEQRIDRAASRTDVSSVTLAFPKLLTREPVHPSISLQASGIRSVSEIALPIDRIALATMRDKMPRVFQKAVIRAIAKAGSRKAADKASRKVSGNGKLGNVLGFAMRLGADTALSVTEEADKRAWTTLPARIEVARMWLPQGTHDLTLSVAGGKTRTVSGITIKPGQRVFLTHRTIP